MNLFQRWVQDKALKSFSTSYWYLLNPSPRGTTNLNSVAREVFGKTLPTGLPSWVSKETEDLRRYGQKKPCHLKSQTSKRRLKELNSQLNQSLQHDEVKHLQKHDIATASPSPAEIDLPINIDSPSREVTVKVIKSLKRNKASGLENGITPEALLDGGEAMVTIVHDFCREKKTSWIQT